MVLWPIFKIADAAIFAGVAVILVWQKRFFAKVGMAIESDAPIETSISEAVGPEADAREPEPS